MQAVTDAFMLDFHGSKTLRIKMSEVCAARWSAETCRFRAMISADEEFHIRGKALAERLSSSAIYVVADNDCLILGDNFVKRGVEIMERHQEYGLLAAANICEGEFTSGTDWQKFSEVEERPTVGGVAFVRKGILSEFKMCPPPKVDWVICDEIHENGYKTGIMPSVRFNHIGAGYSLSNPNWWMKVPG